MCAHANTHTYTYLILLHGYGGCKDPEPEWEDWGINDWNYFNQYDPIWLVKTTNTAQPLAIWIDVGEHDDKVRHCGQGSDRCVEAFHALLLERNIAHDWH